MKRKEVVAGFALFGIITAAVALFVLGDGKVAIRCSRDQEGRLIVDLKPNRRVNAFYTVSFWLEGDDEYLWVLEEDQVPIRHIVYGDIPRGATQEHPAHDVPPKQLPNVGILYVGVDYQWDSTIPPAACISSSAVKLQLTEDGGVKPLGDAELGEGLIKPDNSKTP